jgi:hypothetical protein
MYARYMSLVLLPILAGCAATQTPPASLQSESTATARQSESTLRAEGSSAMPAAAVAATGSVNVQELSQRTVCEQIRRPGSRIVIANRCYTPDANPEGDARRAELVRQQMDELRREQEAMERMALEREREMARQRALMMQQR